MIQHLLLTVSRRDLETSTTVYSATCHKNSRLTLTLILTFRLSASKTSGMAWRACIECLPSIYWRVDAKGKRVVVTWQQNGRPVTHGQWSPILDHYNWITCTEWTWIQVRAINPHDGRRTRSHPSNSPVVFTKKSTVAGIQYRHVNKHNDIGGSQPCLLITTAADRRVPPGVTGSYNNSMGTRDKTERYCARNYMGDVWACWSVFLRIDTQMLTSAQKTDRMVYRNPFLSKPHTTFATTST